MTGRLFVLMFLSLIRSAFAKSSPHVSADSIAPDYDRAVDLCLIHKFTEAELLLKQIVHRPNHPNHDLAQLLLTEEIYLWRGMYDRYVQFADSSGLTLPNYAFARTMRQQPAIRAELQADSVVAGFTLKKQGHIVVEMIVNGKPRKFMVDTGCQRSVISANLAKELQLPRLLNDSLINSLKQIIPMSVCLLDSLQLSGLRVVNLPVGVTSMWGFGVDGALGWDVLRHFCLTIDYKTRQLVLRRPVSRPVTIKNLLGGSIPLLVVRSDTGDWLTLFFDSGSNERISFSPNGITKIGPYQSGRRLGLQLGFGGRVRIRREVTVRETNVSIDGRVMRLRNARVDQANELICGVIIDGTVGSGQFRRGRLTVDYLNNYVDYVE